LPGDADAVDEVRRRRTDTKRAASRDVTLDVANDRGIARVEVGDAGDTLRGRAHRVGRHRALVAVEPLFHLGGLTERTDDAHGGRGVARRGVHVARDVEVALRLERIVHRDRLDAPG